jgi:hypothetical protein
MPCTRRRLRWRAKHRERRPLNLFHWSKRKGVRNLLPCSRPHVRQRLQTRRV